MRNKQIIQQIYTDVINSQLTGLIDAIYEENVIHHDSSRASGAAAQVTYFNSLNNANPNHSASVKHIVADGEYVAVHWHFSSMPNDEATGRANIDLYRLSDSMVVEQWNVSVSSAALNPSNNSMFSDLYDYGNTLPNSDPSVEEANKVIVTTFYTESFNNKNFTLFDATIGPSYFQHNPHISNGSESVRGFIEGATNLNVNIFLSLSEADLIWTFQRASNGNLSVVDLWRMDNNIDKVVEHWDVY